MVAQCWSCVSRSGLSKDYEVFVLSKIAEAQRSSATTRELSHNVRNDLGPITAAAAILLTDSLPLAASRISML